MQGAGGAEKQIAPLPRPHPIEQVSGEHRGGTATAGRPAVNVLSLQVKEHHAAVTVVPPQINAVGGEQVDDDLHAQFPQVAGNDQVIEGGGTVGILKVLGDGVIGRPCHGGAMLLASLIPLSWMRPGVT